MPSYVGPARLVVDGATLDVAVNLQSFVELSDVLSGATERWRGVVVDAEFVAESRSARPAEVRLPDGRGATGVLIERRLEGPGRGPLA